jgi:hypothetical protein
VGVGQVKEAHRPGLIPVVSRVLYAKLVQRKVLGAKTSLAQVCRKSRLSLVKEPYVTHKKRPSNACAALRSAICQKIPT